MIIRTSRSEKETKSLAHALAKKLKRGNVVALFGDLGTGKTVFVQGLAEGLGIKKRILSPTFVFMRSYPIKKDQKKLTFNHLDLYRLGSKNNLGLSEIFSKDSISVIEWADKIKNLLPKKRINVSLQIKNGKTRQIQISTS